MGRVRYIDAFECQGCFNTYMTEEGANKCCEVESIKQKGFECKQCFKIYKDLSEARGCCPELKSEKIIPELPFVDEVSEHDISDEVLIGGISVREKGDEE